MSARHVPTPCICKVMPAGRQASRLLKYLDAKAPPRACEIKHVRFSFDDSPLSKEEAGTKFKAIVSDWIAAYAANRPWVIIEERDDAGRLHLRVYLKEQP